MNIFYNTEFLKSEIEETRKKDREAEVECERIKFNNRAVRKSMLNTLESFNNLIMNNSSFNLNAIRDYLSKLLSVTQSREYEFKCTNNYIETIVYQSPFPRSEKCFYNVYYLIPKLSLEPPREEKITYGVEKSFFDVNSEVIVLRKDNMINKRNNDISFYDKNGNKSINTKNIDAVYQFINELINYRIENNVDEIPAFEIDNFIQKYSPQLKKVKHL